jgi:hypothetical protein
MKDVEEKLVRVREECAYYTEHEAQDGKKYYFNTKMNVSTWDKPKCMTDVTGWLRKNFCLIGLIIKN